MKETLECEAAAYLKRASHDLSISEEDWQHLGMHPYTTAYVRNAFMNMIVALKSFCLQNIYTEPAHSKNLPKNVFYEKTSTGVTRSDAMWPGAGRVHKFECSSSRKNGSLKRVKKH